MRLPHPFAFFVKGWETTAASVKGLPDMPQRVSRLRGSFHDPLRSEMTRSIIDADDRVVHDREGHDFYSCRINPGKGVALAAGVRSCSGFRNGGWPQRLKAAQQRHILARL